MQFQGRFYRTAANPTEERGKDHLYVASAPEGPFHVLRCNVPGVASRLLLSNHYGLLLTTHSGVYQLELAKPGVALKPDADEAARDAAEAKRWHVVVNPEFFDAKALRTALDDATRKSFDGDFAGALDGLNRLIVALPLATAVRHYRGALLDVLGEEELALADYREVLRDPRPSAALESRPGRPGDLDHPQPPGSAGRGRSRTAPLLRGPERRIFGRTGMSTSSTSSSIAAPTKPPWRPRCNWWSRPPSESPTWRASITFSVSAANWPATSPAP